MHWVILILNCGFSLRECFYFIITLNSINYLDFIVTQYFGGLYIYVVRKALIKLL